LKYPAQLYSLPAQKQSKLNVLGIQKLVLDCNRGAKLLQLCGIIGKNSDFETSWETLSASGGLFTKEVRNLNLSCSAELLS